MKRIGTFLVLVGLSAAGSACGPGDASRTAFDDPYCGPLMAKVDSFMATYEGREWPEDRYGGIAVVGSIGGMEGFDPVTAGEVAPAQHMQFVTHMTLLEFDHDLEMRPYLAESWEVSEDRSEVTFHLRNDVFWHDGHPTTAEDVAFTFRVFSDPASGYPNQSFFGPYMSEGNGVEVVDTHTVRFRFEPHADFLETWRGQPIFPEHLLGDVPVDSLASHPYSTTCPVGNGPYRFVDREIGESWTFGPNLAFPEALGGRPGLDRYVYRTISDHATLLAELLAGGVDVFVQMLSNQAETAASEDHLRVWSFPFPSIFFVAWNSRVPELASPDVRRALTLGMDRQRMIDGVQMGGARILNTSLPPVHWAYDSSLDDSLAYDPEQARALLDGAGWTDRNGDGVRENADGTPLEIELIFNQNQERQELAELMRLQLQEIGIRLVPQVMEFGAWRDYTFGSEKDFEGSLVTFETGFRVDDWDLFHSEAVDGAFALSGTMDPELDRYRIRSS